MKAQELKEVFASFVTKKIMVIGDVMVDSYLWGKVDRISPEAPVPVINCQSRENRLGGAANVALNLQALGAHPILCGVIGNNDSGTLFLQLMQENHLDNTGTFIVQGRPTTVKTRIIGGNQQLLRVDEETDKALDGVHEQEFTQHIIKTIKNIKVDAIIFQDYDKGAITPFLIEKITSTANQLDIPVLVDPKKRNFHSYQNVTLFKPNFKEFTEGLKIDINKGNFDAIHHAGAEFQKHLNIKNLMITLSEKGVIMNDLEKYHHIAAHIRDIADVSGAGDTVISVASLCWACGLTPAQTAAISNLAGGLVCEKVGVVPIDKKRLEEEALLLNLSDLK